MYNGIGLSSVRGSATSGYVQANRSHVREAKRRHKQERNLNSSKKKTYSIISSAARQEGSFEIQDHQAKREIENQLLILREDMEDYGKLSSTEIEERIQKERQRLLNRMSDNNRREEGKISSSNIPAGEGGKNQYFRDNYHHHRSYPHNNNNRNRGYYSRNNNNNYDRQKNHRARTTANEAMKLRDNERLANAFDIRRETHVEGAAFDKELQLQKKNERKRERELKRLEGLTKEEGEEEETEEKEPSPDDKKKKENKKSSNRKKRRKYSDSSSDSSSGSSSSSSFSSSSFSSDDSSSDDSSRDNRRRRRRRRRNRSRSSSFSDSQ